jgi:hypothetical protein
MGRHSMERDLLRLTTIYLEYIMDETVEEDFDVGC